MMANSPTVKETMTTNERKVFSGLKFCRARKTVADVTRMTPHVMLRTLAVALSKIECIVMGLGRKMKVSVRMEKYQCR